MKIEAEVDPSSLHSADTDNNNFTSKNRSIALDPRNSHSNPSAIDPSVAASNGHLNPNFNPGISSPYLSSYNTKHASSPPGASFMSKTPNIPAAGLAFPGPPVDDTNSPNGMVNNPPASENKASIPPMKPYQAPPPMSGANNHPPSYIPQYNMYSVPHPSSHQPSILPYQQQSQHQQHTLIPPNPTNSSAPINQLTPTLPPQSHPPPPPPHLPNSSNDHQVFPPQTHDAAYAQQPHPQPIQPHHNGSAQDPNPAGQSGIPAGNGGARLRVSKACDRCRTQKIKCSGTYPCNTCTKHKKNCNYSDATSTQFPTSASSHKRLKVQSDSPGNYNTYETVPKQEYTILPQQTTSGDHRYASLQNGLPIISHSDENRSYINHLENRVQYLESLLSNNSTSTFKNVEHKEPENTETPQIICGPSNKWRYSRRHQNALVGELNRFMYHQLSPESKNQVTVPRTQYFAWNMSGVNYVTSEPLPDLPEFTLPRDKMFYIDFFLKEVNPLFAILHEHILREQVEAYDLLMEQMRDDDPGTGSSDASSSRAHKTNQTKLFTAILCLVYALSIRFTEFSKREGPSVEVLKIEETLFKYSHRVVSILSFEWESFELIQSWLLICLYLRVSHRQTSSYSAIGTAISMTRSMGLCNLERSTVNATPYELLKARRIFWCVYTFDRLFGLQSGRYNGFNDSDVRRPFPSYNYEEEVKRDDWLTIPAFICIHMARLANMVHTSANDNMDLIKFQQLNRDLVVIKVWLDENGFTDNEIFPDSGASSVKNEGISSLIKTEVKLHYYDLIMSVHGRILFNFVGRRIANQGLKAEMVVEASQGIIRLMNKVNQAGYMYTPWYLHMLLIFNVGIGSVALINGGIFVSEAKTLIANAMNLLTVLKKAPVLEKNGRTILKERFKMAKECLWALKMSNHILSLKLRESYEDLTNIGIDHGSSDVNKQSFTQTGYISDTDKDDKMYELFEEQKYRLHKGGKVPLENRHNENPKSKRGKRKRGAVAGTAASASSAAPTGANLLKPNAPPNISPSGTDDSPDASSKNDSSSLGDELLGNLQWFDQWLDFNHDL